MSDCNMAVGAEYYRRYEELQFLLEQAYVDIYSLEEIEKYNKSVHEDGRALTKSSFNVLGHICELLKADLGLTIWKIYSDDDAKANTIKHLSTYIHLNCSDIVDASTLPKMGLPSELRDAKSRLTTLRKNHLAHNDSQKAHASIQISEMVAIVENLRTKLNGLCFTKLDARAREITDQQLLSIKFNVSFGLGMMIHKSTFPLNKQSNQ